MTLEERLCLARAGYSAQDIAGFEAAQNFSDPVPAPDPAPASDPAPAPQPEKPIWAAALEKSISDLAKVMQASNIQFVDMGDPETPSQQAEQALATYITGAQPEKAKTGGKRK